jgi:hypothetical protein
MAVLSSCFIQTVKDNDLVREKGDLSDLILMVGYLDLSNGDCGNLNNNSLGGDWGSGITISESWGSFGIGEGWGSSVGKGWGSSVGKSGGSFSIGNSWGSSSIGNMSNLLVDGVAGLLDDGSLDNLVDGVDLVGLSNSVGLGNLNGVGLGNVGLVDNLALNWDWVGDGEIDWDLVDLELWFNAGHLGGDLGVGANWSKDVFL